MHAMHIRDLDLNLLVLFDALLRERSVTRAAAEVGLSQGAMSHGLNRLRTFFEDPLFIKTSAGMQPTEKAVLLGTTVTEVMTALRQRVVSQARFDPASARRTFVISMTDMGELVFLPPLIRRLRKVAPDCAVRSVQVPLEQIEATLAAGWYLTTTEAKAAHEAALQDAADNAPPTRDELKRKADELGLSYPGNIPTEKLSAMVDAALKG
jgi:hypothetical protein